MFKIAFMFLGISISLAQAQTTSSTLPKGTEVTTRSQMKPHVGVLAGIAGGEGSVSNAGSFGLDFGYQPYIPTSLGLELSTSRHTIDKEEVQRTNLLARVAYNFGGQKILIKDSYVALAAGPIFQSGGTELGLAPMIGFDIPLKTQDRYFLTLGLNAKYLAVTGSPDTASLNGAVKYWY